MRVNKLKYEKGDKMNQMAFTHPDDLVICQTNWQPEGLMGGLYIMKGLYTMVLCLSLTFPFQTALAMKKIRLNAHLTRQVEAILDTSQLLHQSLTQNEHDRTEAYMTHIKHLIISAKQASYKEASNTLHLRHILNNTERALQQASLYTQERQKKQKIKTMFNQFVLLSQTYQFSSNYPVYFCAKDKSVWLQKGGKIRNPIHSHYARCGSIVN